MRYTGKITAGIRMFLGGMLVVVGLSSCSQMNKLLKSGDSEAIYQKGLQEYEAKKWRKASTYFEVAYNDMYTSERVDTILFYLGKSQYNMGHYDVSSEIFDQYRKNFGRRSFSEEAEFLLPMSYYHLSRTVERDQTETRKAMVTFTEYLNRYPESVRGEDIKEMLNELQLKLYQKEFINASLYEKLREYPAAVTALRAALKDSPETPYREEMMYMICKSWYEYAEKSIPQRKLDRYMKMVDAYYNFVGEYPQSKAYKRSLDRMFAEAKAYVDFNQQLTLDVEKKKIDIESMQEQIQDQKERLKTMTDQLERHIAKNKLKADQAHLRWMKQVTKAEAKQLKKNSSKKNIKLEMEAEAATATE